MDCWLLGGTLLGGHFWFFWFSSALYLVRNVLQLNAICFDVILWALILAFLPMLPTSFIHCAYAVGLDGQRGDVNVFFIDCRVSMSGLFCRCA